MEGRRGLLFCLVAYLISLLLIPSKLDAFSNLSIKQGIKYDAPESAVDIAPFIALYELNINEMLDPPNSFSASIKNFISCV